MEKRREGRPYKWKSVEELKPKIDEYFEITDEEDWTVTGLALHLNTTRDTIIDYQKKDEFSDTIKNAKLKVEMSYEKILKKKGHSGAIFGLKNFGWKDKQEVETSGELNITRTIINGTQS